MQAGAERRALADERARPRDRQIGGVDVGKRNRRPDE
jgi:hypothetical protein